MMPQSPVPPIFTAAEQAAVAAAAEALQ